MEVNISMNNFGLGLILSFTDNATSGMKKATGAFNELNQSVTAFSNANEAEAALLQLSTSAGIMGNELYRVGNQITSVFTNAIQAINDTGTTILSARTQLSTLYGDAESGQKVLDQIKNYAAKSIFNFEDLIPSVIMLKANGIEAFDQIATSAYRASNGVEGVSQTLMDYAADLAAFNPQMHNMYGTGVQAAMGALNEYIAEGNAMSLKRGASLDILQILGEEKGKTIEERSRQVADLIEQLGMVGMTANLAGTPMQRLSNVSDVFFNLMTDIADSGVFEKYTQLVEKFTEYLFSIPDEELKQMAKIISEALVEIMTPLEYVIDLGIKAVDWLRNLVKQNPEMTKMIIKGTALAGVFLLITGESLRLLSALGRLKFALSTLFSVGTNSNGLKLLGLLKNITLYLLPIIATVTLLKLAWDRDFMGMQDRVKTFVRETIDTFKILFDALGDYTLSEDNFERAKELGILPLVEAVLQLKYHLGFLMDGFKKGFSAFFDQLGKVLVRMGILDEETHGFRDLITKLIEKITAPGLTDNWEKIGYALGNIAGWLIVTLALLPAIIKAVKLIVGAVKVIVRLLGVIKAVVSWLPKIIAFMSDLVFYLQYGWYILTSSILPALGNFFATLGGWISNAVVWILSAIGNIVIAILGAFGVVVTLPAWLVGLIVVAIAAIIALVWHFRDEIAAFLVETWWKIEALFKNIFDWFANTKIGKIIVNIISTIIEAIKKIVNVVRNVVKSVIKFLTPIVKFIANIVKTVFNFAKRIYIAIVSIITSIVSVLWERIKAITQIIKAAVTLVWHIIKSVANLIKTIIMSIWQVIKSVIGLIKSIIYAVYQFIRVIVLSIVLVFKTLWEIIISGLTTVADFFKSVFTWIYNNVISPIVEAIATAFDWMVENVFTPVGEFFTSLFEGMASVVRWLKDKVIVPVFTGIKNFIITAIQKVDEVVTPIINAIAEAIDWVADKLSSVIDTARDFFGDVGDFFGDIGDGIGSMIGLSTGGYVKTTGIAVLHPNEVVVNDRLTKNLGTFLEDYSMAKETSSPLITQDIVATDDFREEDDSNPITPEPVVVEDDSDRTKPDGPMQEYINNTTNNTSNSTENNDGDTYNDNSVVFESGSIVFNVSKDSDFSNMTEEELKSVADTLMKIMTRKLQLKGMQTRK